MWREIFADDINVLNDFANTRNTFGCSQIFTGKMLKENMVHKINCTYWKFEDPKFTILLGFKFNQGTEKLQWMSFLILNCIKDDLLEALKNLCEKTKEIMVELNLDLINEYDYKELELYNQTFKFGYYKTMNILKNEFENIGVKCVFDDDKVEVSL